MNFQQILPSDNFSELVQKVNQNFITVLQSGGGPSGPKGDQGNIGPIGPIGERGTRWWYGTDDPNNLVFIDEKESDFYLRSDGSVWILETQWVDTGISLKGPQGDSSDSGLTKAGICVQSGTAPADGEDFKYLSPSGEYFCLSGRAYTPLVIGGSPNGTQLCSTDIGNISCTYWKDINITQSTLFVHTPQVSGSRHITFSRPEGTGIGSSQNSCNINELAYLNINTYDALIVKAPRRIDNSLRSCNSDGIILSTDDSNINLSSARDISITTTGTPLSNRACTGNSINSTGNITISSNEGSCGGYAGSAIKIFKGSGSDLGRGGIRIGNGCLNNGDVRVYSIGDICNVSGNSFKVDTFSSIDMSSSNMNMNITGLTNIEGDSFNVNAGEGIFLNGGNSFTISSDDIQIESKSSNIINRTPVGSSRHIFTSTCNAQNSGLTVEFENSGESRIHVQSACSCISTIRLGGQGRNISTLNRSEMIYDRGSSLFTLRVYSNINETLDNVIIASPTQVEVCSNFVNINGVVTIPSAVLCSPVACNLNVGTLTNRCSATFCSTVNLNSNVCTNSTGTIDINKPVTFSNNVTFCAFTGSLRFLGCTYLGQSSVMSLCGADSQIRLSSTSSISMLENSTISSSICTRTITVPDGFAATVNPSQFTTLRVVRCEGAAPNLALNGGGIRDGQLINILPGRNNLGCYPNVDISVVGGPSIMPGNFTLACTGKRLIWSCIENSWIVLD